MEKADLTLQSYTRVPDYSVRHRPDFNPRRYISIQDRVNSDRNFEINYINKLISEGWFIIEDNNMILDERMKGRHFKYRLNGKSISKASPGTFRSGGIIIGKNKDDVKYVMYKAYNGCIFPLQLDDVQEIYIKDPNVKIEGNKKERVINETVYFNDPGRPTSFAVYLKSPLTGEDIAVYYAKDNYKRDRFMMTKKFEYAYKTGDWDIVA